MAALAGEPWRGAARADHYVTASPASFRSAWVTFTSGSPQPTGAQAIWEGAPGSLLTLRFKWSQGGTPTGSAPNFATVECRLPGGAIIGAAWTVTFPAADTEVTRTFHFDSAPLSEVLDAVRAGTLELYLNWGNSGGVSPWNADSRGGGTPASLSSIDNARGYVRAPLTLQNHSISNVAIAGVEPAQFVATDAVHTRLTVDAVAYRSIAPKLDLRRPSNGAMERSQTHAGGTGVNFDYSWTGQTGNNRRIGNGMELAAELKDLRFDLPNLAAFTGTSADQEYVFAASGHQAGWTIDSAQSLRRANRITVDPRHTGTVQAQRVSPRVDAGNQTSYIIGAHQLFPWGRIQNARAEALSGLTLDQRIKKLDGSTVISDLTKITGADGWTPAATPPEFTDGVKAPEGNRTQEMTVTAPADQTGLGTFTQTLGFSSALTAERMPNILCPDEIAVGVAQEFQFEYRKSDGTRVTLDSAPSMRVYNLDAAGAEVEVLAIAAMTVFTGQQAWRRSWTPAAEGVYAIEVRATFQAVVIEAVRTVMVRPRFKPRLGPLVDRM